MKAKKVCGLLQVEVQIPVTCLHINMLACFLILSLSLSSGLREGSACDLIGSKYSRYLCNDIGRFSEIVTPPHAGPSQEVLNQTHSDIVSPWMDGREGKLWNCVIVRATLLSFALISPTNAILRAVVSFYFEGFSKVLQLQGLGQTCLAREKVKSCSCLYHIWCFKEAGGKKIVLQTCCQTQYQWDYWISSRHGLNEKTTQPKNTRCPLIL